MSDADLLLKDLLAVDEPPARDVAFTLAVMEKVARRRFWLEAVMWLPMLLAAGLVSWALAPSLTEMAVRWGAPAGQSVLWPVLALVGTLAAFGLLGREPARA